MRYRLGTFLRQLRWKLFSGIRPVESSDDVFFVTGVGGRRSIPNNISKEVTRRHR